ncbi:hypothetical protein L207DRAFT_634014 [Hyaloscypha variabilis F]|uniref:Heterokaryon incompatibility domain-containing protein n=1 Tax=Hyaloscypha variabilis (strain UAMH 11265 / GT02V1 / F) TaxID=1149755 RepID=A0A2J6RLQ1_HYAVF|nr:hypothetical protein L207DRAFT_634014 [Hyaloscypha variabilis F]
MELEEYFDDAIPEYAILSHTWGKEEVSFQEWTSLFRHRKLEKRFGKSIEYMFASLELDTIHERSGYSKIERCAEEARSNGIDYVWIDTCCIDKTSSAELSEAINSMFRWYEDSVICYAYLSDVATLDGLEHEDSDFNDLVFFDQGWNGSRNKNDILEVISKITGIPEQFISGRERFQSACFARKMAWASKRTTTRKEDMAYCLLGIFEVNMPLLYGEGEGAFMRLQEEIVKQTQDQSFLALGLDLPANRDYFGGVFAPSPADFEGCRYLRSLTDYYLEPSQMTNKGLQIRLRVWSNENCSDFVYGEIECGDTTDRLIFPLIPLVPCAKKSLDDGDGFWRSPNSVAIRIQNENPYFRQEKSSDYYSRMPTAWKKKLITLYIRRNLNGIWGFVSRKIDWLFTIEGLSSLSPDTLLKEVFPPTCWVEDNNIFRFDPYVGSDKERIFLRFHSPREQADSVVVFQTQYRLGGYIIMKSNIHSWEDIHADRHIFSREQVNADLQLLSMEQIHTDRQFLSLGEIETYQAHKKEAREKDAIRTVAELFWNDPDFLQDDFWLITPTGTSHVLQVDLTKAEPSSICNITRRFE